MKNLFLTLVVALFVNTAFAFSNSEDPKPVLVETSKELKHLLNSVDAEGFLEKEESSRVLFVVNDLNEIVILNINCDNPQIQSYIKKAINYKKLSSKELNVGQNYFFIVDFKVNQN